MSSLTNSYAHEDLTVPMFHKRPTYHPFNPAEHGLVEAPFHVLALPLPKVRGGGGREHLNRRDEGKIFFHFGRL